MVGIVTVVTNEKYNLEGFYNSLKEQTLKDFTLYFVNNNCSDGSKEFLNELNQSGLINIKFIDLKENYGFSAGSNLGAKQAIKDGNKYLFIANNDLILDKDCLHELFKTLEDDKDAVCTVPLLLKHNKREPDTIQEFGGEVNFKTGHLKKHYANQNINNVTLPEKMETDFAGGGICFIRSDIFSELGMFETSYFGYFDEIDLSYRLKVLNNYKMYAVSKAIAWHNHYSSERNKKSYYFEYYLSERNKFLYYYKYKLYSSIILAIIVDTIKFPVRLWWFMKVCDFTLGIYYIRGMFAGLFKKKGRPAFGR